MVKNERSEIGVEIRDVIEWDGKIQLRRRMRKEKR